ncbi:MAG: hypothetical protein AB7W37_06490 [Syntrophobacteraceae bacterium]
MKANSRPLTLDDLSREELLRLVYAVRGEAFDLSEASLWWIRYEQLNHSIDVVLSQYRILDKDDSMPLKQLSDMRLKLSKKMERLYAEQNKAWKRYCQLSNWDNP